jgi:hypothetical protein
MEVIELIENSEIIYDYCTLLREYTITDIDFNDMEDKYYVGEAVHEFYKNGLLLNSIRKHSQTTDVRMNRDSNMPQGYSVYNMYMASLLASGQPVNIHRMFIIRNDLTLNKYGLFCITSELENILTDNVILDKYSLRSETSSDYTNNTPDVELYASSSIIYNLMYFRGIPIASDTIEIGKDVPLDSRIQFIIDDMSNQPLSTYRRHLKCVELLKDNIINKYINYDDIRQEAENHAMVELKRINPFNRMDEDRLINFCATYIDIICLRGEELRGLLIHTSRYIELSLNLVNNNYNGTFTLELSKLYSESLDDVELKYNISSLMKRVDIRMQLTYIYSGVLVDKIRIDNRLLLESNLANLIYYTTLFGNPTDIAIMPHPLLQIYYTSHECIVTPLALYKIFNNDPSFDKNSHRFNICRLLHKMWRIECNAPVFNYNETTLPYSMFQNGNNKYVKNILYATSLHLDYRFCCMTDIYSNISNMAKLSCNNRVEVLAMGYLYVPISLKSSYKSAQSLKEYVNNVIEVTRADKYITRKLGFYSGTIGITRRLVKPSYIPTFFTASTSGTNRASNASTIVKKEVIYVDSDRKFLVLRGQWLLNRGIYIIVYNYSTIPTYSYVQSTGATYVEKLIKMYKPSVEITQAINS